jgi:hypothetical protein
MAADMSDYERSTASATYGALRERAASAAFVTHGRRLQRGGWFAGAQA